MIFSSLGSNLGAGYQFDQWSIAFINLPNGEAVAIDREGDTYPWLVGKVVCLTRIVVLADCRETVEGEGLGGGAPEGGG